MCHTDTCEHLHVCYADPRVHICLCAMWTCTNIYTLCHVDMREHVCMCATWTHVNMYTRVHDMCIPQHVFLVCVCAGIFHVHPLVHLGAVCKCGSVQAGMPCVRTCVCPPKCMCVCWRCSVLTWVSLALLAPTPAPLGLCMAGAQGPDDFNLHWPVLSEAP